MTADLLEELTNNAAPLLALVILHSVLITRLRRGERWVAWLFGLLFGLTTLIGMAYPFTLQTGLIFDGRSVVLALAGFFGGPQVAVIAALIAAAYRILIGGSGLWMGLGVIATSTGIGIAGHWLKNSGRLKPRSISFLALGLIVHLCSLLWMLALPEELRWVVISGVAVPYLGVLTLSTWAFGHAFQLVESREVALREASEAEGRFRNLVEGSLVGVYLVQDGLFVYTSPALEIVFGYPPGGLLGRPVDDLVMPEDRPLVHDKLASATSDGEHFLRYLVQARHADGHGFRVEVFGSRVQRDGRPAVVGMLVDVTDREQAAQRLVESERLLRESQQVGRIGSYELRIAERRWVVSSVVDDIFGISSDHPHSYEAWVERVVPEQRQELVTYLQQVLAAGGRFDREYQILRPGDGERRWLHGLGTVEHDPSGRPVRMYGTIQDISSRKEAELAAQASEARFRSLVAAMPDLVWLKDPDGVYLACNPPFERLFGAKEADILGKTDFDFVDAEQAEFFRRKDREALAAGRPSVNEETLTIAADGRTIQVETIKTPLLDARGELVGVLGVARDITQRKQAELALRHSEDLHEEAQRVAQIGHWQMDHADGRLTWSGQTYDIFELDPSTSELSYELFLGAIHPADRERVNAAFAESVANRSPYAVTHRLLLPDGRIKFVEERGETFFAADGSPQRSMGTVQDVTLRRTAEIELARELDNTRMMLGAMTDGYVRTDVEGRILDANQAYCRMLGYQRGELVGRRMDELKRPGAESEVPERIRHILDAGQLRFSTQHRRKDGGLVDIEASAVSMAQAEPPQLACFFRDVTQEKRVEAQYQELVNRIPAGVFRYRTVADGGRFEYVSPRFADLLEIDAAEVLAQPEQAFEHLAAGDIALISTLRAAAREGAQPFAWEGELKLGERTRWLRVEAGATAEANGDLVWHGIVSDVTERQQLLERLRLDSAVIASTFESIMVTDLAARVVSVNPAFSEVTGYGADEVLGRNARLLKSGRHDVSFYQEMYRALREAGHWQGQVWNRRKTGELFPELLNISVVRDSAGRPTHYVGVASDISQIKHSEERLEHLAHHDALTDLPNRLMLGTRLEYALERARREQRELAVLFLDLDRFKTVNDSLGHQIGDQLLVSVAERLKQSLGTAGILGRLGGDEFLVLLEDMSSSMAVAQLAQTLLKALEPPFLLVSGHELFVQASVGISLFPADGDRAEILIRNADSAMFRAKELGRNNYQFYTRALTLAASERLNIETRMRRGIQNGEFKVWYQPIYRFADRRLIGAEALVRWQPPDGPMIFPDQFIPVAEDSGMILELGRQVLQTGCADLRGWLDQGLKVETLAVNLSAQQFRAPNFEQMVAASIAAADVPPQILELEITERGLMDLGDETLAKLGALKQAGVRLAIDDFGTGYSSLAYLKQMPVDKLKIDRGFVQDLPRDSSDVAIVQAVIAIAGILHQRVLAEGVETLEQLEFLRSAGCDECQGFLFGRAVPPEQFAEQLRQNRLPDGVGQGS
ncbi:MAG: PAS domain S-box protein [Nevskiaceae bacterium]|nr:MAG: PAS domain S-box protein [Nevskiaceae bacterium]TAM32905.1 MAG: PAS domain S-box protein [Nevskiaceae bacterium]